MRVFKDNRFLQMMITVVSREKSMAYPELCMLLIMRLRFSKGLNP